MKIAVVGAGTMGNGIAQVCAWHGLSVVLKEVDQGALDRGSAAIDKSLSRVLAKLDLDDSSREERKREVIDRIRPTLQWEDLAEADFAIEAVFEDFEVKRDVLTQLERVCRDDIVLASNTSSISITRLAATLGDPSRAIGMHFMNPVPIMKLVEIIRGLDTSDETMSRTERLTLELGKTPVEVNDFPGFVSNRVLMPLINEAAFALMEGVARPEAIDKVMTLGMNHPMGPLKLADLIGLDVCLDILNVLHEGFKDPRFRPCPLLRKMVDAKRLGRKTGRGFYDYAG